MARLRTHNNRRGAKARRAALDRRLPSSPRWWDDAGVFERIYRGGLPLSSGLGRRRLLGEDPEPVLFPKAGLGATKVDSEHAFETVVIKKTASVGMTELSLADLDAEVLAKLEGKFAQLLAAATLTVITPPCIPSPPRPAYWGRSVGLIDWKSPGS